MPLDKFRDKPATAAIADAVFPPAGAALPAGFIGVAA
jgi:hypothetical protein